MTRCKTHRLPLPCASFKRSLLHCPPCHLTNHPTTTRIIPGRAIATTADVYLAAAHDHFGSTQGLLVAVIRERATPINSHRLQTLTELESQPGELLVDAIMVTFFAPFVSGELSEGCPHIMARAFGALADRQP